MPFLSGTYNLDPTLGALQVGAVAGETVTVTGNIDPTIAMAGCAETLTRKCMIFFVDPSGTGGVTVTLSSLSISGGHSDLGGGGILAGSLTATPDILNVANCTITGNSATGGSSGGGISFAHGTLNVNNCGFNVNHATGGGNGGGIDFADTTGGDTLNVANSSFSLNTSDAILNGGGGAIHLLGVGSSYSVSTSLFQGNTALNATAPGGGGAILKDSGTLALTGSNFIDNSAGAAGAGGAVNSESDGSDLGHAGAPGLNRFAGSIAAAGSGQSLFRDTGNVGVVTAEDNWWGTNTPSTSDAAKNVVLGEWFELRLSASPVFVLPGGATTLTGDLSHTNLGATPGIVSMVFLPIPVSWPSPTLGALSGAATQLNGSAQAGATYTSTGGPGTGTASVRVDAQTVTINIPILGPITISKAFGATTVPLNASTSLTFTLNNPNPITTVTGIAFSDSLPAGLVVATPNGLGGTCAATSTATAGSSSITVSAVTLAGAASCTFSVNVRGVVAGTWTNTTGNVTSTQAGDGGTASASIDVVGPPHISKSFSPGSIALHATTSLFFTIASPAGNTVALTGVAFTDPLPAGLSVANGSTAVCGGTLAMTGSNTISLSGATVGAGASCNFTVTVTGAASGTFENTTSLVTSTNGGMGNYTTDVLVVDGPPIIVKSFSAAKVPVGGTATLTFTIGNPNASDSLSGIAFTDSLPAGLVVATPSGLTGTCDGGSISAPAGSTTVSLSAASLAPSSSCAFSVNVTGTSAGVKDNTVSVTSIEGGTGLPSSASITVVDRPTISKVFGAASIPLNGSTTLTFTITNPNASLALTGVGFSDTLPAGLTISTPNGLIGNCGGGTITATQGTSLLSLAGASLAAGGSCVFAVNVTGTAAGTQNNTTGNVTSIEGGSGGTASASITVVAPPSIAKSFSPGNIALNATASLSFTITNPNPTVGLTGVAFADTLPNGLTVANGSASVCGGTVATTAPTTISLSGATVAAGGTCTFSVTVTGAASGNYTNTTGAVTSDNGGTGDTASARLLVASPPTIGKSFGVASVPLNGSTTLSFTITNPNTTLALTGVAFTDNLPAGLVVATPDGLTGSCGGGIIIAAAGSSSISLSGATLISAAGCSFSVNVTGTAAGVKDNSVLVTSIEGGPGNPSNASITVVAPPTISKVFGAASIPLHGSTTLTFTINNPNASTSVTGIGFVDALPGGLVVSSPNGLTGGCDGGTVTAVAGSTSVSLSGATLAPSASCTFSVNVTGTTAGSKENTTGSVTSSEGGSGGTASASIVVVAPPSIAKSFSPGHIGLNASTSLSFTITNPNPTVGLTGVAFTDALPTGLTVANGSASVCGGTVATTAPTTISLSGGSVAAGSTCTFTVNVTGTTSGSYTNVTGAVTSTNGGTGNSASANLEVASPPTIVKSFGAASVPLNGSTTLTFTVNNLNTTVTLTGVAFTDNLPAGLVVAAPSGLSGSCGGAVTAAAGGSLVSLGSGTIAPSSSCTISVNVTGTSAGVKNNSVSVTSTEGGPGNTSNATITVVAPPTIGKSFGAASIPLNGSTSLSFTITNPNASTTVTGIGFVDTLPAGLVVSSPNGLTGGCGGGIVTAAAGSNSVSLSGAALAAGATCTFSVSVTGTTAGNKQNTTSALASNEGGTGGTAIASIVVVAPPSISKAFGRARINVHRSTTLTFTITNPNAVSLTGVGFTDTLPAGLVISTPNGLTGSCGGGTIVALAGTSTISLSGATLPANSSCTFAVRITANKRGNYTNVTGGVTSANGGVGNTASARLRVTGGGDDGGDDSNGDKQDGDQQSGGERDSPDGHF